MTSRGSSGDLHQMSHRPRSRILLVSAVGGTAALLVAVFVLLSTVTPLTLPPCGEAPCVLSMYGLTESIPNPETSWATLTLGPTAQLTTSQFRLDLQNLSAARDVPSGTAPSDLCVAHSRFNSSNCGPPTSGTWYGVLVNNSTHVVVEVFTGDAWIGPSISVTASMVLVIVSSSSSRLSGSGDVVFAHGTGSASVTGASPPL